MAYYGSTQATTLANPPKLLTGQFAANPSTVGGTQTLTTQGSGNNPAGGAAGGNLWFYASTNLTTDISASNFFSDGFYLGMKAGDIVQGVQLSASAGSSLVTFVGAVASVSTAGASLSTGSLITSTFN